MKCAVKAFFAKDWSCEEKVLLLSVISLAGILMGFLLAPNKKRLFYIGNNNTSTTCDCDCDCDCEETQD